MPATTFKAMFTDAKPGNLVYKPASPELADQAKARDLPRAGAEVPLRSRGRPRARDLGHPRRTSAITDNIALGIQIFLGIIGALTLLVGGMGVANIMYAVVKERTREIGVKMALGAKVRQVMAPFVLEALLMTVIGGVARHLVALGLMAGIAALPLKGDAFDFLGRAHLLPGHRRSPPRVVLGGDRHAGRLLPRPPRGRVVNPAVSLRYE